jgi:Tol biopolymer transport system component
LKSSLLFSGLLAFLISAAPATAQVPSFSEIVSLSPFWNYKEFETEHFKFTYVEGLDSFAKKAAQHLEHAHTILSPLLKWQPRFKTHVLVIDNIDASNGFALAPLRVGIVLYATPPEAWFSSAYAEDWIKNLTFHEYVHILNIDPTSGAWELARWVFGDVIRPNGLWAPWLVEGLAVYFETRTSLLGRGRSPYYAGIVRTQIAENRLDKPDGLDLAIVNGTIPQFPAGEIPYLFGGEIVKTFKSDTFWGDLSYESSSSLPYSQTAAWPGAWKKFVQDTTERETRNLAQLKQDGLSQVKLVTDTGYEAIGGAVSPSGEWMAYSAESLTKRPGLYLKNLRTQATTWIRDKLMGVGLSFSPDSKHLFFSELNQWKNFSTYSDLWVYSLKHDSSRQLTRGLRAKDPDISPDGKQIAFTMTRAGTTQLAIAQVHNLEKKPRLKHIEQPIKIPEFSLVSNPKWLPDSTQVVFSLQTFGQPQVDLMVYNTKTKKLSTLVSDGSFNRFPAISPKGVIHFTSDRSGIIQIYAIADGQKTKQVTRVIGASWLPFFHPNGTLYASQLHAKGWDIAELSSAPEAPLTQALPKQESIEAALQSPEIKIEASREYSPWSSLAPRYWAPGVLVSDFTKGGPLLGAEVLGFDSVGHHQYLAGAGYRFDPNVIDTTIQYTNFSFGPMVDIRYSLFSRDITSTRFTRTEEGSVSFRFPFATTYARFTPRISAVLQTNRFRDRASLATLSSSQYEFSKNAIPSVVATMTYSNAEFSRQGPFPEAGWTIVGGTQALFNSAVAQPAWKYLLDARTFLEIADHQVITPRISFLGSTFLTDNIDSYTQLESASGVGSTQGGSSSLLTLGVRGYPGLDVITRAAARSSIDYAFPLTFLFRGGQTSPLFFSQIFGLVFVENTTIFGRTRLYQLPSVGTGVGLDFTALYRLPLRATLQIQRGLNTRFTPETEVVFGFSTGSLY